jgi:hypothetical protein
MSKKEVEAEFRNDLARAMRELSLQIEGKSNGEKRGERDDEGKC